MNVVELEKKLLRAARAHPPGEQVPYAFEKRIMNALKPLAADSWSIWGQALWRATVPCLALMLVLGAWSYLSLTPPPSNNLSQEMDNTVLAAIDQPSWVQASRLRLLANAMLRVG
jgi:hypothetical protein